MAMLRTQKAARTAHDLEERKMFERYVRERTALKKHPLVRAVLERFPGSFIAKVRLDGDRQ